MGTHLPFDEKTSAMRNYSGIVNGMNPRLYNAGEAVNAQIN